MLGHSKLLGSLRKQKKAEQNKRKPQHVKYWNTTEKKKKKEKLTSTCNPLPLNTHKVTPQHSKYHSAPETPKSTQQFSVFVQGTPHRVQKKAKEKHTLSSNSCHFWKEQAQLRTTGLVNRPGIYFRKIWSLKTKISTAHFNLSLCVCQQVCSNINICHFTNTK